MDSRIAWIGEEWPGSEQLALRVSDSAVEADGIVIALVGGHPLRLSYSIRCDAAWRVRSVDVEIHDDGQMHLTSDGEGHWWTGPGEPLDALTGCYDVDLRATPFTNTIPIRRLGLLPGESRAVPIAFIDVPDLEVRRVEQRYTCVEASVHGAVYRFESGAFSANLSVDGDGLVVDYPGGWRRADTVDS